VVVNRRDALAVETAVPVVNVDQQTGYDSIQAAVDNASAGDTIRITSGTYDERLTVDTSNLTILGGDGAKLTGGGTGIRISADNTTIQNIAIENDRFGVVVNTAAVTNLTLEEVTVSGSDNGLRVGAAASVDGLRVVDSTFDSNEIGVYLAHPQPDDGDVTDVTFEETTFRNNTEKALYAETLSNATFDTVRVVGGQDGFDINLKAGNYTDLTVTDSVFDSLDSEALKFKEYDGTGGNFGGGPNYVLGDVTVNNVTVADSYAAIWAYGYRQTDLKESTFEGNEYHFLIDPEAVGASNLSSLVEDESLDNEFARAALVESQSSVVYAGFERAFAEEEVSSGDTVTVYEGTYAEDVTIDVANVTLRGPNAGTPGASDDRDPEATLKGQLVVTA
jgi:hypothetical protein